MILTPALAPMRVAPALTIASASSRVRTPPAALTPMCGPHGAAHKRHIGHGGAARGKAGRSFHVIGAAFLGQQARGDLLFFGQQCRLDNDFDQDGCPLGARVADAHHRPNIARHHLIIARLERANVDDHINLGRALVDGSWAS